MTDNRHAVRDASGRYAPADAAEQSLTQAALSRIGQGLDVAALLSNQRSLEPSTPHPNH